MKRLLIIGTSDEVWDDLSRYDHLHRGDRMAINRMILDYPGVLQHAVSLHPEVLEGFTRVRSLHHPEHVITHCCHGDPVPGGIPEFVWPDIRRDGSSGLFAALVGLHIWYDEIVLAGVGLTAWNYYSPPGGEPVDYWGQYKLGWLKELGLLYGRVTSLSGHTRKLLGEPHES